MFLSLAIALAVYLPLLLVVSAAGVEPGESISQLAGEHGDTVFALAVSRFLGTPGYWLVIVAAILSTLSALHANLLAASRVALSMAQDHTLPVVLGTVHAGRKTPVMAIYATALTVVAITFMIPDLGAAGAAASLIFLISFTLTHITTYLARVRRKQAATEFRTPWFPLVPAAGGLACGGLAIFQAVLIPDAGGVVLIWLALGVILYIALFKHGAETADASAEALDPSLAKLRGKNPLVLLPIANPDHARSMVAVANAMAPTEFARVLLLTIVATSKSGDRDEILAKLKDAQSVVREALGASYADGQAPEAMITAARDPWAEIRRVAELHNCQSIVLGFGDSVKSTLETNAENLLNQVDCDVAIIRAANDWQLDKAERILVPVGGRGHEHEFRARVLGSVCRERPREVTFVTVLKTGASESQAAETLRDISSLAEVNVPGTPKVVLLRSDDPAAALIEEARQHDLLILGLKSVRWGRKVIGDFPLRIARESPTAVIMLSSRRSRAYSELYRPIRDAVHVLPWLSPDTQQ
jgi:nucleotide-binding universal stress UspA family protein